MTRNLIASAANHPTDKNTVHSYLPIYERLFSNLRNTTNPVLEIGVDGGGSLCIWQEYFTKADVFGMDINVCPEYIVGKPRIKHWRGDSYSKAGIDAAISFQTMGFSVIVDDGPHSIESQRDFCRTYPILLDYDGIAIVEDIQDFNQIQSLVDSIPAGFHSAVIDLRHVKNRYDDVLLTIWRK